MEIDVIHITRVLLHAMMHCFIGKTHEHSWTTFSFGRVSKMSTILPLLDKKQSIFGLETIHGYLHSEWGSEPWSQVVTRDKRGDILLSMCEPMYPDPLVTPFLLHLCQFLIVDSIMRLQSIIISKEVFFFPVHDLSLSFWILPFSPFVFVRWCICPLCMTSACVLDLLSLFDCVLLTRLLKGNVFLNFNFCGMFAIVSSNTTMQFNMATFLFYTADVVVQRIFNPKVAEAIILAWNKTYSSTIAVTVPSSITGL